MMAASNLSSLRRQVKNVAYNYSETQVKVREATSNDPWGPSSSLMSEIADLTNNTVAFTEIMQMIWKRLNDKNKNWRHVYKSLVLLDYLIKCGSERVGQQCKENIFSVETLKSFQHIEDNKDQGHNIRQKATQIVALLKDDEKLRNERARAIMARKRFVQNSMGISSDGSTTRPYGRADSNAHGGEGVIDEARPTSVGEEEMQLQIALALSREEAQREEDARKGDEIRLQLALQESKHDKAQPAHNGFGGGGGAAGSSSSNHHQQMSAIDDLLSLGPALSGAQPVDPWGTSSSSAMAPPQPMQQQHMTLNDPWSPPTTGAVHVSRAHTHCAGMSHPVATMKSSDPWAPPPAAQTVYPSLQSNGLNTNDPWAPVAGGNSAATMTNSSSMGQHHMLMNSTAPPGSGSFETWGDMTASMNASGAINQHNATTIEQNNNLNKVRSDLQEKRKQTKTPETFLGANSSLVNLDELLGPTTAPSLAAIKPTQNRSSSANPFLTAAASATPAAYGGGAVAATPTANPFAAAQRPSPSLNQMRAQNTLALGAEASNMAGVGADWSSPLPQPLQPQPAPTNPFL